MADATDPDAEDRQPVVAGAETESRGGKKKLKTIMLVDDQLDLRTLVRMTLEDPTLRIVEADNGDDAVDLARRELPDLVLLDWMMPGGRNGIQVLEALRQEPTTATIPVIMLTSRDEAEDFDLTSAAGAMAHLTKPFSPLELLQTVERVL